MKTETFNGTLLNFDDTLEVSSLPDFDNDLGYQSIMEAREFVEDISRVESKGFDSLVLATALSFYNFSKNLDTQQQDKFRPVLFERLKDLIDKEVGASDFNYEIARAAAREDNAWQVREVLEGASREVKQYVATLGV